MSKLISYFVSIAIIALGFGFDLFDLSLPGAITCWVLGGLLLLITIVYKVLKKYRKQISPLVEQEDFETIDVQPASMDDLRWIANEEKKAYAGIDVMPWDTIESWYRKNPNCFWIIKDIDGSRIGNIYFLPIKPKPLKQFLNGEILEREISSNDLYSSKQLKNIKALHICSLVCRKNHKGARSCLKNLPKMISQMCDPSKMEVIYALSASQEGLNLLKRRGFSEIASAAYRKDHHPLYSVRLLDLLQNIANRLSQVERVEFDSLLKALQ